MLLINLNSFYNLANENDFQNEYLMSSIMAEIKNEAALNIASYNIKNWDDLKSALLNSYSDKRDLFSLNIELCELKQFHNKSCFDFFNRVQKHLNLSIP